MGLFLRLFDKNKHSICLKKNIICIPFPEKKVFFVKFTITITLSDMDCSISLREFNLKKEIIFFSLLNTIILCNSVKKGFFLYIKTLILKYMEKCMFNFNELTFDNFMWKRSAKITLLMRRVNITHWEIVRRVKVFSLCSSKVYLASAADNRYYNYSIYGQ